MYTFLSWTECIVTFFFLILSLSLTLGHRRNNVPRAVSLLLALCVFAVVYKPIETHTDQFWIYWWIMLVLGVTYAAVFTTAGLAIQITVCVTYLAWITLIKSTISGVLDATVADWHMFPGYLLFYGLFYSMLLLCTLFMQAHPLHIPTYFPAKYWLCMICTPALIANIVNLNITGSHLKIDEVMSASSASGGVYSSTLFFLLFFASLMSYYLSYIITTTSDTLTESRVMNQKLEMQLNHIDRSSGMVEQIRRDKHEMKNVYFYIQSLLESDQIDELKAFVNDKLVHRFDAYEEFRTGNQLMDFLLTQKVSEARDHNIHVMTNVLMPGSLSIDENDLCGILLNLIDNAIDASKNEENRDIHITVRQVKNYLDIEVKNSCSTDVLKSNPALKTTKNDKENHGFGMRIIDSIVRKYNGIKDVRMENSYFTVEIMLQNKAIV